MSKAYAHLQGCSRENVRPSHYLPGAGVCGSCGRMVPDYQATPRRPLAEQPRQPTLIEEEADDAAVHEG